MINQGNVHAIKPIFIEVPTNSDVTERAVQFARHYQVSIVVPSSQGL